MARTGGPDIVVNADLIVVGRDPGCDARIDSLRVSRMHCCLIEVGGVVLVRDLGSTNGIRINGRRRQSGRLRPGDELSVAHLRYRVKENSSARMTRADDPTALSPGGSPWSPRSWTSSLRDPSSSQDASPSTGEW
jgi:pSer/pThr/pTyr-binding forkhead associated (FHA) protein